jgi:glycerol-3-phosphate acyltransferase PlsY
MNSFIATFMLLILAYLSGAVPFGLLIVRRVAGVDIRHTGSGNIGATNVRRVAGNKWATAALVCDMLKGLVPTAVAISLNNTDYLWLPAITSLAAVCGHMYPIYLKFKPSGKGVATAMGSLLLVAPWAILCAVTAFVMAAKVSRRVSVGSLAGTFLLPSSTWFTTHDPFLTLSSLIIMILILTRHKENIQRLAQGREPVIGKTIKIQRYR